MKIKSVEAQKILLSTTDSIQESPNTQIITVMNRAFYDAHASTDDFTVSDSEVAESILRYLGFAVEPSLEPYVDRKRDHVAKIVRAAIDADRRLRNGL